MAEHNCDLCNSDKRTPLPGDPSGRISICGDCGFIYVPQRRSTAEVAASWDDIYNSGGYDPNWPGVKARLYYVAEWIDQNIGWAGKDVLDIGAGKGQFVRFLPYYLPHLITALEPCARPDGIPNFIDWQTATCEDGLEPIAGTGAYDIITINWTLENTADALGMLRFARDHLKPDGRVVVATGSRILVPFKKPLRHYIPQDANYPHDTHCFRWSWKSLLNAGAIAGLYADQWNDFNDRDEMVVSFEIGPSCRFGEMPSEVENHFKHWLAMFP